MSKGLFSGKSRHLARHHIPSLLSVRSVIKEFDMGEKVVVMPKGNFKDIPHPRYKGKIGKIIGKRGTSYIVEVSAMTAKRKLIVNPKYLEKRIGEKA